MGATFTTGKETAVGARERVADSPEAEPGPFSDRPVAEVTFPNASWDPVTIMRPFPTYDEAKAAAKAVADRLNRLAPQGFRTLRHTPEDERARAAIEEFARGWGAEDPDTATCEVID